RHLPSQKSGRCQLFWEEPTQMQDTDDLALWYALNRLMTNYWADVDHNGGSRAHEFYLPEALFAVGNNRFEGPEKIRAFYTRRRRPSGFDLDRPPTPLKDGAFSVTARNSPVSGFRLPSPL